MTCLKELIKYRIAASNHHLGLRDRPPLWQGQGRQQLRSIASQLFKTELCSDLLKQQSFSNFNEDDETKPFI